jgi:2-keto-4-pentenoate hydratase/2-oxohepta-3-ene-1,7-dioic acid hydratase in catechol pathway
MSERDFRGGSAHQWTKREETVQRAATAMIVHRVAKLVSYLSPFAMLHPGDVISKDTPPGVGLGMTPQRFLGLGDAMELGASGLGMQHRQAVADPAG